MSALANVPGLAGYLEAQQQNDARSTGDLQKAAMIQGLLAHMQQQAQAQKVQQALASSGGDVEKAAAAAMQAGDYQAAAHLAPLAKQASERRQAEELRRAITELNAPQPAAPAPQQNPMVPGPGASVMAGSGTAPPAPAPVAPQLDPSQARIAHLKKLETLYATNPIVAQRIQAEIEKVTQAAEKPPQKRERIEGENLVQEEYDSAAKKWKEVGRGPRFARQIAPVGGGQEPMMPVKEPDGRIIYVPRSQAAGREVGGRVTDINLGKQVQQLGRDIEKADLPPTIAVLRRAESLTPDLAQYVTGPMSALPDRAIPQAARDARQDVQRLFNIVLKQRSGAAVTNQEMDRLKQEFGSGLIKTPNQLMTAIGRMREIIESHYTSIAGGYGKDALDTYNANIEAVGGSPFEVRPKGGAGAKTPPGAPQAQQGPYTDAEKEKRYQEWKARQAK